MKRESIEKSWFDVDQSLHIFLAVWFFKLINLRETQFWHQRNSRHNFIWWGFPAKFKDVVISRVKLCFKIRRYFAGIVA